jgi:hypothetical protein
MLTKEELLQIANEAVVRYQQKDFITHEKARKQSKKW